MQVAVACSFAPTNKNDALLYALMGACHRGIDLSGWCFILFFFLSLGTRTTNTTKRQRCRPRRRVGTGAFSSRVARVTHTASAASACTTETPRFKNRTTSKLASYFFFSLPPFRTQCLCVRSEPERMETGAAKRNRVGLTVSF